MESLITSENRISVSIEEIAKQYNHTIASLKEKIVKQDIPIISADHCEAIAKKYLNIFSVIKAEQN